MDLLPTLAAYAGAALPEREIDGMDVRSVLEHPGTALSPRKDFYYFGFCPSFASAQDDPIPCAVRSEAWKLHARIAGQVLDTSQLYDFGQ